VGQARSESPADRHRRLTEASQRRADRHRGDGGQQRADAEQQPAAEASFVVRHRSKLAATAVIAIVVVFAIVLFVPLVLH
jgi:hypothetical protein